MGTVKRILCLLRDTQDLYITYRYNISFELVGFCDASYDTGSPEKARSTSGSITFSFRGHPRQRQYLLRQ